MDTYARKGTRKELSKCPEVPLHNLTKLFLSALYKKSKPKHCFSDTSCHVCSICHVSFFLKLLRSDNRKYLTHLFWLQQQHKRRNKLCPAESGPPSSKTCSMLLVNRQGNNHRNVTARTIVSNSCYMYTKTTKQNFRSLKSPPGQCVTCHLPLVSFSPCSGTLQTIYRDLCF